MFLIGFSGTAFIANSQIPQLSPVAATIWDAYFPDGAHRATSDRLFPVIPTIGYNTNATSQSFYFDTDVALYAPGIAELHTRGIKYYMFLEFTVLEVSIDSLMAHDPLIPSKDFGACVGLDSSYGGLSFNRPDYRNFVIRCVKRGIDAGADGIQFDMAGSQFEASFDPDDVVAFREYMKENYDPSVWEAEGVGDIDTLDYRHWLYNDLGYSEFPVTFDESPTDPPLKKEWILFKLHQIQESWQIFSDSMKGYAMSQYGREFTIIGNNGALGLFGQHGLRTMGDVCGEYFGYSDDYPRRGFTYPNHKLSHAIGKRHLIWSLPWNDGDEGEGCNCQNVEFDLHMMAESFASGGLSEFAGEAVERDDHAKYFYMVQRQRDLFNAMNPYGEVGVILAMPTTALAWGMIDQCQGAQRLMQDIGRSYEVVIAGTDLGWPDELALEQLTKYKVVVLHEAIKLTDNQVDVFLNYTNQGGKLLVFGTGLCPGITGGLDELGNTRTNPTWESFVTGSTRISDYGSGKIIFIKEEDDAPDGYCKTYWRYRGTNETDKETIAANILSTVRTFVDSLLEEENVRVTIPENVQIFRSQDTITKTMLYHLVNADVDSLTRLHKTVTNKIVQIALMDQLADDDSVAVTTYNPDDPEGTFLGNFKVEDGRAQITVSELFIWRMYKIEEKKSASPIRISNLRTTNAFYTYRLKSHTSPHFAWHIETGVQQQYQFQIWDNATFYGSPVYESGWIASSDTVFNYPDTNLEDGKTYIAMVRIKNASDDTSGWTETSFHVNYPPYAPNHLYGISAAIEPSANPVFWWAEARDYEGDSVKYFWQLYTDSIYDNFSDSTNLYFIHSSPYSYHVPALGDGVFDTLQPNIEVDNFGFWWKVFSCDGLDTSARSRWARFTWDHIDNPPKAFGLISPANNASITGAPMNYTFNWENNGDMDPNKTLKSWDLIISEKSNFSPSVSYNTNTIPKTVNPFPISGHKIIYWKVKAIDQSDNERYSNETRKAYIDNGTTNTAPTKPVLTEPCNGCSADSSTYLRWQLSTDPQGDTVYYRLEIDSATGFTSAFITMDDICDMSGPYVDIKLNTLQNYNLLKQGKTYYWRVRANDRYANGTTLYSDVFSFVFDPTVGIDNISDNNLIAVYPNPVSSISILDLTEIDETDLTVTVYNSTGQSVMKTSELKNKQLIIDKKQYSCGTYSYEVYSKYKIIGKGRFVVE